MKPGRNDLCPCGSGKKFKHCCLAASAPEEPDATSPTSRPLQRAIEGFFGRMVQFIDDVYGSQAVHEAWDEFTLWGGDSPEDFVDSPHAQLFFPWFFHRWMPDPEDTSIEDKALHGLSPTQVYLQQKSGSVDSLLHRYLQTCVETPFSFYELIEPRADQPPQVRDVFTGTVLSFSDSVAPPPEDAGKIIFAQFVQIDGAVVTEAIAPQAFRPVNKIPLIEIRKEMTEGGKIEPTPALLIEWDMALREQYLQMMEQAVNPPRESIYNVDGEKIDPYLITYDIDSAQVAFDALKDLCGTHSEQELLDSAERGPNGELQHIELDWTRPRDSTDANWNTIFLAAIEIFPDHMVTEVNSVERVEKLKTIIEERLGEHARHISTESMLDEDEDDDNYDDIFGSEDDGFQDDGDDSEFVPESEEAILAHVPELAEKLNEMMMSYYENWATEQLPALGGRTPIESVNDPDGREMVEALIRDIEISGASMAPPLDASIPRRMRERLGLSQRV